MIFPLSSAIIMCLSSFEIAISTMRFVRPESTEVTSSRLKELKWFIRTLLVYIEKFNLTI